MENFKIETIELKRIEPNGFCLDCDGVHHKKFLDCLSIVQSVEGSYDIKIDGGQTFSTGEKGVFVAPAHAFQEITHFCGKNKVMSAQWVFIDAVVNETHRFDEIFSFPVVLDKKYNDEIFELIYGLRFEKSYFKKIQATYRLLEILHEQSVLNKPSSSTKTDIEKFVRENYTQNINATSIAKALNCSPSQVFKYTNKFFGLSPANYVNSVRLQQAEKALLYTKKNVTEISYAVGFSDTAYFSKLFKQNYSLCPIAYRKIYTI